MIFNLKKRKATLKQEDMGLFYRVCTSVLGVQTVLFYYAYVARCLYELINEI
jgi:hypothetical protein